MDESRRERTLQCSIGNELKIRREFLIDPRRISLRRTFDQVRGALPRACLHDLLSLRGHGATKIHPFQYLMVGAALCLFYLLLLSISEFVGFGWAYLVATVASTMLIT